jgi:pimeloyl-ACP methyl ester carboxylesterase
MITATPTRQNHLDLADGRRLAYAEFGDMDGRPVVLLHGNPGSRLMCPDLDACVGAEVRLVTFDRPGIGGSDRLRFHRLQDVADDLAQLAERLALSSFAVVGWSAGGPYALATAVFHPGLVTGVVVVSGAGLADDPEVLTAMGHDRQLVEELRARSPGALDTVEARFASFVDDPGRPLEAALQNRANPDRGLLGAPEVRAAMLAMWEESARQGTAGLADGWAAVWALPWGFQPTAVTQPVAVWHGTADPVVSVGRAERLAAALPRAKLQLFEGSGHLLAVDRWGEILAATL